MTIACQRKFRKLLARSTGKHSQPGAPSGREWLKIHNHEEHSQVFARLRSLTLVHSSNLITARSKPRLQIGPIKLIGPICCGTSTARSRVPTSTRDSSKQARLENPS